MKRLLLLIAVSLLSGCASNPYLAVGADGVSTYAALARGGLEMNPAGWLTIPIRIGLLEHAKTLPEHERIQVEHSTDAAGWGAAVNNLLVFVTPAAPVIGIAVGVYLWNRGAPEREFYEHCARHKLVVNNPNLRCVFKT